MKKLNLLLIALLISFQFHGQEDLLEELESDVEIENTATAAFKGLKIVNL